VDHAGASAGICGAPATPIHAVQGAGASSPLAGRTGIEIEGVVVGDFRGYPERLGGFFVQEEDRDADASAQTSEGIFVFASDTDLERGDTVRVRGAVREFFGLTELGEIESVQRCWPRGAASPAALRLPVASPGDWERVEGMLVRVEQPLVASGAQDLSRFGELVLGAGERLWAPTQRAAPGEPARAWHERNLRHRLLLDDGRQMEPSPTPYLVTSGGGRLRLGDRVDGLEGVVDYGFGSFRIQPTAPVRFESTSERRAPARARDGALRVAAWNVENFFNGDGLGGGFPTRGAATAAELERQRAQLVETLAVLDADVYALVELENDGAAPRSAAHELAGALAARTGAPIGIVDAGANALGGQEIAVGLLYRRDRVRASGPPAVLDERADPTFDTSRNRPTLVQTFVHAATGEPVAVAVNHWKSKGSPCDSAGDPDAGDGQGECNLTRTRAATALAAWLARDPTNAGTAPALVVGDLNAYPREDPIRALLASGLVDLLDVFAGPDAYSYVFDGAAGRLDHAFASASLIPFAARVEVWHAHADEPPRVEPVRASDHDPVIVDLFPDADRDGITDARDPLPGCTLGDAFTAFRTRSGLRGTANAAARRELLRRCRPTPR
jgi:predicted extracellular nuclease